MTGAGRANPGRLHGRERAAPSLVQPRICARGLADHRGGTECHGAGGQSTSVERDLCSVCIGFRGHANRTRQNAKEIAELCANAALAPRVAELERLVAALQRERNPSAADVALLLAFAEQADGSGFTVKQIQDWAGAYETIAAALDAASVESSTEIACWLRGMRGVAVAGLELARGSRASAGYTWRVQVCRSTYTVADAV